MLAPTLERLAMQTHPSGLSDEQVVEKIRTIVSREFLSLAELLSLLAEMDDRMLYAKPGFSSLFAFIVKELHLSEHAAYNRITAARAAKRFPLILTLIAEEKIHLTAITTLAPILTQENHEELLSKAVHASKLEVERIRAISAPRPDLPDMLRTLPDATRSGTSRGQEICEDSGAASPAASAVPDAPERLERCSVTAPPCTPARRDAVSPLSEQRVKIQFTGSEKLRSKIERAKELLRHKHPQGKLEEIFEEALDALLAKKDPEIRIEQKRRRSVSMQRSQKSGHPQTRHIPQHVKDLVWQRDQEKCQYVSPDGRRCEERGFLEFDHIEPFAKGGSSDDPDNLRLACRAHNQWAMRTIFGTRPPPRQLSID
jgi:5-methylcytosine-specific restriction endonuclease McrA